MSDIVIRVDDPVLSARLAELQDRLGDLKPFYEKVAQLLQASTDQAFEDEADPVTGKPWDPLKPTTIRRRLKAQAWPGKILQVQGRLASSIVPAVGTDFAAVGTNYLFGEGPYGAEVHQLGTKDGTIPARPFLGLSDDAREDILDLLVKYLD